MAVEHSQDKRQLAAWVDRQLAETVDSVATKRGITRTAAITEALQRYVEEETSVALQLSGFAEKLDAILEQNEKMQQELEEIKQQKPKARKTKSAATRRSPNAVAVLARKRCARDHLHHRRHTRVLRHRKAFKLPLRRNRPDKGRLRHHMRGLRTSMEQLDQRAILAQMA